jgi:hypothetical protein
VVHKITPTTSGAKIGRRFPPHPPPDRCAALLASSARGKSPRPTNSRVRGKPGRSVGERKIAPALGNCGRFWDFRDGASVGARPVGGAGGLSARRRANLAGACDGGLIPNGAAGCGCGW